MMLKILQLILNRYKLAYINYGNKSNRYLQFSNPVQFKINISFSLVTILKFSLLYSSELFCFHNYVCLHVPKCNLFCTKKLHSDPEI